MEALATLNNQRQFDFQNNGIEVMDLETLQRTYKENDIYGNPVRGIYHYQVIQRMTVLDDPNVNMSPTEVMDFYSMNYPELTTATVHGPEIEDDRAVYEFKTTIGVKG